MANEISPVDLIKAKKVFKADMRDSTTPTAMTQLLKKLFMNEN